MPYTIIHDPREHWIETRLWGVIGPAEAQALVTAIVEACAAADCVLCLTDYRDAQLRLSTLDIYRIPAKVAEAAAAAHGLPWQRLKRALLVRESQLADLSFFETVTVNNNQKVRLFLDAEQARQWLRQE